MDLNPHIPKVGSQLTSGPRNDAHYFLAGPASTGAREGGGGSEERGRGKEGRRGHHRKGGREERGREGEGRGEEGREGEGKHAYKAEQRFQQA